MVDGRGNPVRFILTAGPENDITQPGRSHRKVTVVYDRHRYGERHLVECLIGQMKCCRRVFTRFEKLSRRYLGFGHFTASLIWLR